MSKENIEKGVSYYVGAEGMPESRKLLTAVREGSTIVVQDPDTPSGRSPNRTDLRAILGKLLRDEKGDIFIIHKVPMERVGPYFRPLKDVDDETLEKMVHTVLDRNERKKKTSPRKSRENRRVA